MSTTFPRNRHSQFENEFPEYLPDLNIMLNSVAMTVTRVPGLARRLVYDYAHTPDQRRMTQLMLLPGTKVPLHRLTDLVDMYVLGGDVEVAAQGLTAQAKAGDFVILEPDTCVQFTSRYGASLLLWADEPSHWEDGAARAELYGFAASHSDPLRLARDPSIQAPTALPKSS